MSFFFQAEDGIRDGHVTGVQTCALPIFAGAGIQYSPTSEVLLEESILGWKEYEFEMMRDSADNVIALCSIENFGPVGVHTGDAITVAPAVPLTDREYQKMRDISIKIIREVGVATGGCNIQFAVNPEDGRIIVIEMNPRVSRSSALASKATGYPIAKIATKLSLGYTLDELTNDITGTTTAAFEPALDYVVVKVPRFAFEKFPAADATLTTTMKAVGEVMSFGRNFAEALQKALRSLEQNDDAELDFTVPDATEVAALLEGAKTATTARLGQVQRALLGGATPAQIFEITQIDPWFIDQLVLLNEVATEIRHAAELTKDVLAHAKRHGFSDRQIGQLRHMDEAVVRGVRHALGLRPVYKSVDTAAGEHIAQAPYHYSSYDGQETEITEHTRSTVVILGSGPNRIGQGVEFDYSCVHATMAMQQAGYDTVLVNCNPETVSTDSDMSDRLYFEPLTLEDVLEIIHAEKQTGPVAGVFVQLGGQTPLKLAQDLADAGVTILGTSPEAIDLAEHRGLFSQVLQEAGLAAPKNGTAVSFDDAKAIADEIGYPVLVRPSYVLGGRGMEIVYGEEQLASYIQNSTAEITAEHPVLVDRFLDDAIEIDVDALYDGHELFMGGIMEHIEEAGVHSGDSACVLPPTTLAPDVLARVREATEAIAKGVGVRGLINIQFALAADVLYVIEANPRASRTVPFVSKATGVALAKAAAKIGVGSSIAQLRQTGDLPATHDGWSLPLGAPIAVKEAVLPFTRFRTPEGRVVDSLLGPEMRSTGEVMGIDKYFDTAYAKYQDDVCGRLPTTGRVFISVANRDKRGIVAHAKRLTDMGFGLVSTGGTADVLARNGIVTEIVDKITSDAEETGDTIQNEKKSSRTKITIMCLTCQCTHIRAHHLLTSSN